MALHATASDLSSGVFGLAGRIPVLESILLTILIEPGFELGMIRFRFCEK
jgi:hypothetical protein